MDRFLRTDILLGKERSNKLKKSSVTIIGLGAVGSYAAEAIARSGVNNIRLIDFDTVKATNINRNLLALTSTIGKTKVEAAKERILDINPRCNVETLCEFAAADTLEKLLTGRTDLVIDAIDSVKPKVQLLSFCHKKGFNVISSMGAALRRDPFSIKAGDLFKTKGCPLALQLRKRLRKEGIKKGILCVYSDEKHDKDAVIDPKDANEENSYKRGRERRILGSTPTLTGIFGLVIANLAIDILTQST